MTNVSTCVLASAHSPEGAKSQNNPMPPEWRVTQRVWKRRDVPGASVCAKRNSSSTPFPPAKARPRTCPAAVRLAARRPRIQVRGFASLHTMMSTRTPFSVLLLILMWATRLTFVHMQNAVPGAASPKLWPTSQGFCSERCLGLLARVIGAPEVRYISQREKGEVWYI